MFDVQLELVGHGLAAAVVPVSAAAVLVGGKLPANGCADPDGSTTCKCVLEPRAGSEASESEHWMRLLLFPDLVHRLWMTSNRGRTAVIQR